MKRLADIEANEKSVKKRSATIKTTRRKQASPKRTAIVNPLPMRKLQKAMSERYFAKLSPSFKFNLRLS